MRLAITGGGGFLGYHLCHKLSKQYDEIRILDIAPFDASEYPSNVRYFQTDVRDRNHPLDALRGVDRVVHAAAALPLWKKNEIFEINVEGTRNILETALTSGVDRVVFISSTSVYGVPKQHPLYEYHPVHGVGHYGKSKIQAEKLCQSYRSQGLCVPIVRPKTFLGSGRLGVFQILYDWVENGKKIPIIGKGTNRYQLLEVEDLVDAIGLLLAGDRTTVNDTFNVGAERFTTVKEDVGALCEYAGSGASVLSTPAALVKPILRFFEILKLSPLYQWVYETADTDSFVSIEKIKDRLGWSPQFSNAEALIRSYQWYLHHKHELSGTGVTHRVAWKQGALEWFKRFL